MIRYCFLGLMISLGLCGGCKTTGPKKMPLKLELGRQVAVLKVSTDEPNIRKNHSLGKPAIYSSYKVQVYLWDERLPGANEDVSQLANEADWLQKSMGVEVAADTLVDILSAPQVSLPPNEWRTMESIHRAGSTVAQTSFWVDGELLTVGSHPGLTLKAFVEPLGDNQVRVKGAMVAAKISPDGTRYHAFPFNVELEVGNSAIIYEREVRLTPEK